MCGFAGSPCLVLCGGGAGERQDEEDEEAEEHSKRGGEWEDVGSRMGKVD